MSVNADRDGNGAGEAEISEFDVARFVDQKILRLEISVEDPSTMAKSQALIGRLGMGGDDF